LNKEKVTIQDIADALGLSRNTVSKALNNHPSIPEDTRNKVVRKAVELNYKQFAYFDLEAPQVKKTGNIALISSNLPNNSHFGTTLLSGFEQKMSAEGYNLSIHIVRENDLEMLSLPVNFDKSKVDGILCIELFHKPYSDFIASLGIPTLFVDASSELVFSELKGDVLLMENFHSVYQVTRKFIQEGITDIGFIGDYRHCMSFNERWEGYRKALNDEEVPFDSKYCVLEADRYIADFMWLKERLSNMEEYPSLFICANDFIAIHVIRILKELNIQIPEQVKVCGFDDSLESQIIEPQLTTVHIYRNDMGIIAAEMMLSRIMHPERPAQIMHIRTEQIYRKSTG